MSTSDTDTQPSALPADPSTPHASDPGDAAPTVAEAKKPRRNPLVILLIVVIILAVIGAIWWFLTRNQVGTDDAFIDGNAVTIAPRVTGYVQELDVSDNTYVKQGQVLMRIDPRDYEADLQQSQAQLGLAQTQLDQARDNATLARVQYPAQLAQAKAQEASAQAALTRAELSYRRQHSVNALATTKENIDAADAQLLDARATLASAQAAVRNADQVQTQINLADSNVQSRQKQVDQAQAQVALSQLNLDRTVLRAPQDGWVTMRNVHLGSLVQPGTSLFSLVSPNIWVTANFKESQLDRMRHGDHVTIDVDAYPSMKLRGHVDSVQLGTGSRFSAFPAENATGNFVKIVQRVPVKIVIDSGLDPKLPLGLGLSVEPTVTVK